MLLFLINMKYLNPWQSDFNGKPMFVLLLLLLLVHFLKKKKGKCGCGSQKSEE